MNKIKDVTEGHSHLMNMPQVWEGSERNRLDECRA